MKKHQHFRIQHTKFGIKIKVNDKKYATIRYGLTYFLNLAIEKLFLKILLGMSDKCELEEKCLILHSRQATL